MRKFLLLFLILFINCDSNKNSALGDCTEYKGMVMSKNYYNSIMEFKKDRNIDFDSLIMEIKTSYKMPANSPCRSNNSNNSNDCSRFDKTGQYMSLAIQRVENTGCAISGNYFFGDTYYITAVCPELGGRVDVEIKITNCGEVFDANFN
jgi:hypothetical protein